VLRDPVRVTGQYPNRTATVSLLFRDMLNRMPETMPRTAAPPNRATEMGALVHPKLQSPGNRSPRSDRRPLLLVVYDLVVGFHHFFRLGRWLGCRL
jgi:hypothetical protein